VQLEQITELNKKLAGRLVDPADVATNQQYFYKLESETKVKLTDLRQLPIAGKRKGQAPTLFNTVTYTANVQGDYIHILQFVRQVELGARVCRILSGSLSMSRAAESYNPVLSLSVSVDFEAAL
jgi:hypothetical protein